jgi:phospholipid/cholesterol/gamma-HCH transport system substrate-binding protein
VAAEAEDPFKGFLSDASESTAHLKRILSRIDAGEGLLGKVLRDDELYRRLTDVSLRLQGFLGKLESESGPLGRLVNDTEMSRQLASSVRGIEAFAGRLEAGQEPGRVLEGRRAGRGPEVLVSGLRDVAARLERGEGTAGHLLKDEAFFRKLDGVVTRLDSTLSRLNEGEGALGRALRDPELYNNLNGSLQELRGLLADVRRDPKRYLRVKLSLF